MHQQKKNNTSSETNLVLDTQTAKQLKNLHQILHQIHTDQKEEDLVEEIEYTMVRAWLPDGCYDGNMIYSRLTKLFAIRDIVVATKNYAQNSVSEHILAP